MKRTENQTDETTRILLAAAHLYNDEIYNIVSQRTKNHDNFKADTPEYFIDYDAVVQESKNGRVRERARRMSLLLAVFVGFSAANGLSAPGIILTFIFLWGIELFTEIRRQNHVRKNFLVSNYSNNMGPEEGSKKEERGDYCDQKEQNVIISGGYSPFQGSGYDIFGWSFTIDLTKPENKSKPSDELHVRALYRETTESILSLSIPNLRIEDRLLVNGTDIRSNVTLLPDVVSKPITVAPYEFVNKYIDKNDLKIRHYKMIQIPVWEGQLVLTVYFRFLKIGENLFVESRFFLLTPLKDKFLHVDNLTKRITLRQFGQLLAKSAFKAPFTWVGAIFWILSGFSEIQSSIFPQEVKEVKDNEKYNYGWPESLRETWAQPRYEKYFQILDRDMYFKIVQQRLIDSITESLESRNISTDALKDRGTTIMNEGVMITGGNLKADSMAIGSNASSAIRNIVKTARNMPNSTRENTSR